MGGQARARGPVIIALIAVAVLVSGCPATTFKLRPNLPADPEQRRIVVLTPDVELSVLHAGGVREPNAEWTRLARQHIAQNLAERFTNMRVRLVKHNPGPEESEGDEDEVQLLKLHRAVGGAILVHQFADQPRALPTKADKFEWSLGPDASYLKKKYGADYALFMFVRDSYSSGGRVALNILMAVLGGPIQGGAQVGFASLVNLSTGEVVWFNRLLRGEGDLRTAAGARETVGVLLQDFPQ